MVDGRFLTHLFPVVQRPNLILNILPGLRTEDNHIYQFKKTKWSFEFNLLIFLENLKS